MDMNIIKVPILKRFVHNGRRFGETDDGKAKWYRRFEAETFSPAPDGINDWTCVSVLEVIKHFIKGTRIRWT
jgi:hypothetical protein